MGTTCCSTKSTDQLRTYMNSIDRKKHQVLVNKTSYPLNAEALQTLTLGVLGSFLEISQLTKYSESLREFIQDYNYSKFAPFLVNFQWFMLSENIGSDVKVTQEASDFLTTKSTVFMTTIKENSMTHYANSTNTLKNYSPTLKTQSSLPKSETDKLLDFFKQEIMHKDNFFFELVVFIGQIYSSQYKQAIADFKSVQDQINQTPQDHYVEFQFDENTKSQVEATFLEAKEDIKQFEDFLYNCLKVFLMQISIRNKGDDSLVPLRKDLSDIVFKLLFGKNQCYKTYFSLIRYYTLEDEVALRNSFIRLKGMRPERFAVEQTFCQENCETPYESIIESLDYLDILQNPQEKFDLISSIRRQILKSMDQYRKDETDENQIAILTGEHLLPLFTYFFATSQNQKLRAHQFFIETFLEKDVLEWDKEGYCFLTFEGAINSLISRKDVRESMKSVIRKMSDSTSLVIQNCPSDILLE